MLLALGCAEPPPEEPAWPADAWQPPTPATVEAELRLPAGRRAELVPRAREELLARARERGLARLGTIEVDLRCEPAECRALVRAEAQP